MKLNIKMTQKKILESGFIIKLKMMILKKLEVVLSLLLSIKHLHQDMVKWMEKVFRNTSLKTLKTSVTTYKRLKRISSLKKWKAGNLMLTNYLISSKTYKRSTKERMKFTLLST